METNLKVTIIQSELVWENAEANRTQFSKKMETITEETHLIILPEMITTGFSMNAEKLAEPNDGPTLNWMISEAKKNNCAITGSVIIEENQNFYNRLFFVYPNGEYKKYDKKHTFTFAKENETFTAGNERIIVEYRGWKICPLVCYDLRFPVWSRNTVEYDAVIYVANWPKIRTVAWDSLLKARAIENMAYCIGVNRVGKDGKDIDYSGHSAVYDVLGKQISTFNYEAEFIETITLQKDHITTNRSKFRFLNDRDEFILK